MIVLVLILLLALWVVSTQEPFEIRKSPIAGVGVFAVQGYDPEEQLFLAIQADKSVDQAFGSKINHCPSASPKHNSILQKLGNEWFMVSKRAIQAGEEITTDYHDTPDFIVKPHPSWTC